LKATAKIKIASMSQKKHLSRQFLKGGQKSRFVTLPDLTENNAVVVVGAMGFLSKIDPHFLLNE
jgi:hypothetical protein